MGHGRLQIAEQKRPHFHCQLRRESRTHAVSTKRHNSPLMSQTHKGPDRQNSRGYRENAQDYHDRNRAARAEISSDALKRKNVIDADDLYKSGHIRLSAICPEEHLNELDGYSGQRQPDAAIRAAACPATNTQEMPHKRQS